jgi:hypothetical protein
MHKRTFNQERRVSARRGFVLRMLGCEDRRLCSDWRTSDQERRTSALRGFVLRTLGCEDRRLCSDWRTSDQERRASTRRGCGWANVVRNVVEAHLQSRLRNHGGLTPPAPGCVAPWMRVGKLRLMRCTTARSTKSGGCQPAVVLCYERWAVRIEDCAATGEHPTKSGGRQPAVVR